jgi:hypothetical protein
MKTQQRISETLSEKGMWIRFGHVPFYVRPLTLAQLYDVGACVERMQQVQIAENEQINALVEILSRYTDVKICAEFTVKIMFRRKLTRFLFGWWVRRNLTVHKYEQILKYGTRYMNAAFFLTSLTFLKGVKALTKPTMNTQEATAHGDLSVE